MREGGNNIRRELLLKVIGGRLECYSVMVLYRNRVVRIRPSELYRSGSGREGGVRTAVGGVKVGKCVSEMPSMGTDRAAHIRFMRILSLCSL